MQPRDTLAAYGLIVIRNHLTGMRRGMPRLYNIINELLIILAGFPSFSIIIQLF